MRSLVMVFLAMAVLGCAVEAAEDPNRIAGTVLETLDVSSYTYVRLETPDGEAWAAVPRARLEIGSEVAIANPQVMSNFESNSLGRTFDTIYFGTLEDTPDATPHGSKPHGAAGPREASSTLIEVTKAEGATGRSVAELYAEKGDLSGKTIALRGKVVKYTARIMGRNWIHLQDGTGDASAGTHDITVTSQDTTAVGETILVEGTVTLDKDFGAGYRYAVIVEDASVK